MTEKPIRKDVFTVEQVAFITMLQDMIAHPEVVDLAVEGYQTDDSICLETLATGFWCIIERNRQLSTDIQKQLKEQVVRVFTAPNDDLYVEIKTEASRNRIAHYMPETLAW